MRETKQIDYEKEVKQIYPDAHVVVNPHWPVEYWVRKDPSHKDMFYNL